MLLPDACAEDPAAHSASFITLHQSTSPTTDAYTLLPGPDDAIASCTSQLAGQAPCPDMGHNCFAADVQRKDHNMQGKVSALACCCTATRDWCWGGGCTCVGCRLKSLLLLQGTGANGRLTTDTWPPGLDDECITA
jgi:hypothetical protein